LQLVLRFPVRPSVVMGLVRTQTRVNRIRLGSRGGRRFAGPGGTRSVVEHPDWSDDRLGVLSE